MRQTASWQQVAPPRFGNYNSQAERHRLDLANATGAGGIAAVQDSTKARFRAVHAALMAAHKHLSHGFFGEPALDLRIAACILGDAKKTSALAKTIGEAHEPLMSSPPHRG